MLTALLPILALAPSAMAAEVTDIAPMFRGDLDIRYTLDTESARLMEGDTQVGQRKLATHDLVYAGSFSFYKGAAFFFELPQALSQTVQYPQAQAMTVDANFGSGKEAGTMLNGEELTDPPSPTGKGLNGTWVGFRASPFHRDLWADRGDRASWLIELGYRFKDNTNFWTTKDGKRGGGPGASAFRLGAAFSTRYRASQPYITTRLLRSSRIGTDVVDETGELVASNMQIRPASSADIGVGTELLAATYGQDESAGQLGVDLNLHFGYTSWQDIPSGIYLPSVMDITRSLAVTESEYSYARAGLGLNWRMVEYVQLNLGGYAGTSTPRRIEHPYPISTGMGTLDWGVQTTLRFRARDPLFD